jgi:hypothetical protein
MKTPAIALALFVLALQKAWLDHDWGFRPIAPSVIIVGCVVTADRRLMRAARVLEARTA